jgi:CubicO group peptidase (beta-lactamase class C family)
MVLRERGRIDLDQSVNRYLGAIKVWSPFWNPDQATVRRVATHTAGLTTYAETCYKDESACSSSPVEMIRHYAFIGWKPGDHFDYSNVGYGVLGEVLAHGSGRSFSGALRSTVLGPLGMTECVVLPSDRAVTSYDPDGTRSKISEDVQKGASSAACSAHALMQFAMFSLKDHPGSAHRILSDAEIDEMLTSTVPADGGQRYGLGWWINPDQHGYRVVYASGGTTDRSAMLYLLPSEDVAVVVLMSTGDSQGISGKIADEILAALLPIYAADLAKPATSAANQPSAPPADQLASLAGKWVGQAKTYLGDRAISLVIDPAGARISIGNSAFAPVARARFIDGALLLRSVEVTDLGTPDSNRRPHRLGFELYPNDNGFYGAVTTVPLDSVRSGALLSYPVSLRRVQ